MKFKVSNIDWDTDGEKDLGLPDSMAVEAEDESEAIDVCSDKTGWCIFSATVEEVKP
jgi:hypothetical protein